MTNIETSGKPRHMSTSLKEHRVRTPGGRIIVRYKYKKHSKHVCAICKKELSGKPAGRPVEISRLAKSERRPERPFGGMLCSKDTRMVLSYRAKLRHELIKTDDVPISLRGFVAQHG